MGGCGERMGIPQSTRGTESTGESYGVDSYEADDMEAHPLKHRSEMECSDPVKNGVIPLKHRSEMKCSKSLFSKNPP